MKEIKDLEEVLGKPMSSLLTERLVPVTPPNPFTITCEDKKENNE